MDIKVGTLERARAGKLRRVWWQRPNLAICRHLGDGQFKPPSHLSANLNLVAFGRSITIEGRKEATENVCERNRGS